ncbi:MAG: hypothetical protein IBJ03_15625 [Gemmatimonadaceae bacterium]|nr:hypothetical protein [Gemmatimonadaceae bacterium]
MKHVGSILAGRSGWWSRHMAALLLLLGVGGCGCQLVGCATGIQVTVINAPPGGYVAFARAGSGSNLREIRVTCPGGQGCGDWVMLEGVDTSPVDLTISTPTETRHFTLRPLYQKQEPNGARCGPTCFFAEQTVTWE